MKMLRKLNSLAVVVALLMCMACAWPALAQEEPPPQEPALQLPPGLYMRGGDIVVSDGPDGAAYTTPDQVMAALRAMSAESQAALPTAVNEQTQQEILCAAIAQGTASICIPERTGPKPDIDCVMKCGASVTANSDLKWQSCACRCADTVFNYPEGTHIGSEAKSEVHIGNTVLPRSCWEDNRWYYECTTYETCWQWVRMKDVTAGIVLGWMHWINSKVLHDTYGPGGFCRPPGC